MNVKIEKAASDLETLAAYMYELAEDFRSEEDQYAAYAKVYYLRQDLGRVVGSLGHGIPSRVRTDARPLNMVKR